MFVQDSKMSCMENFISSILLKHYNDAANKKINIFLENKFLRKQQVSFPLITWIIKNCNN